MSAYDLAGYGDMLADATRREAYGAALRATVRPGSRVLEIGTGPGIFALLAARCGAASVVGLETGEIIALARQLAKANDLADRVSFVRETSTAYRPAKRADIVISDLRGVLPPNGDHFAAIADARERLLAPGGTLIPARDRLWAALVTVGDAYEQRLAGFADRFELDLGPARHLLQHGMLRVDLTPEQLLTTPEAWTEIDYLRITDAPLHGRVESVVSKHATAHGIALWFDTELVPGVSFSAAPGAPPTLYRQVALPFPEPIIVEQGDRVRIELDARRAGADYAWRWQTEIGPAGQPRHAFDQSSLDGLVIDPERLAKRSAAFHPLRSADGEAVRAALSRMDGAADLQAIAGELAARNPHRWPSPESALAFVADLAERFG